MIRLSYQAKLRLHRVLVVLGVLALVLILVWLCWLLWLQRYVVYTRDGVHFDFNRSTVTLTDKFQGPLERTDELELDIVISDENAQDASRNNDVITGIYLDSSLLQNMDDVNKALDNLEPGTAVMMDVKSRLGNFYYTTSINGAELSTAVDVPAMDQLISTLSQKNVYLIARVPAFRDTAFAQSNMSCGLALSSGALWTDREKYYWLDPNNDTVQSRLIQECRELREKGFDEVVFADFYFPDSGSISYAADMSKDDIMRLAASRVVTGGANDRFTVSFEGDASFPLPQGSSRIYLVDVAPERAAATAQQMETAFPDARFVFIAETRDTRFDDFSVLRRLG